MDLDRNNFRELLRHFYKHHIRYAKFIGTWPIKEDTTPWRKVLYELQWAQVIYFWTGLYIFCMAIEFVYTLNNLDKVMGVLFMFSTEIAVFAKFMGMRLQREKYKYLNDILFDGTYVPENPTEFEIFRKASTMTRIIQYSFAVLALSALHSIMLVPLITKSGKLPLEAYYPLDKTETRDYTILYVYQYLGLLLHCWLNIIFDTWIPSLQIYVGVQLDVLSERLRNIGKDKKSTRETLIKCSLFHKKILHLATTTESVIKGPFTIQIAISVVVICVNFYALSFISFTENVIKLFASVFYQLTMLAEIFMVCYFGNEVSVKSAALQQALYEADWLDWDMKSRKIMLIMMQRFSRPIKVNAVKLYVFDLNTFTSILNCSYSYFAILRRMNNL